MSVQAITIQIDPRVVASQATFRAVMNAMARPGRIERADITIDVPDPMMPAAASVALSLFDHDTPLWLDPLMHNRDLKQWLRFHTSAPIADAPDRAAFALIADIAAMPPLEDFAFGTADYPDRSTTLIVQVDAFDAGSAWQLRGPGIDGTAMINVGASLHEFITSLALNVKTFPRGIDVVLVSGASILALPRTTRLEPMET